MSTKPLEADLEAAFNKAVEAQGWESAKLVSPSHNGRPDRLVLAHHGVAALAELKRDKNAAISALQVRELRKAQERGFIATRIDSLADVAVFVHRVKLAVARAQWTGGNHNG